MHYAVSKPFTDLNGHMALIVWKARKASELPQGMKRKDGIKQILKKQRFRQVAGGNRLIGGVGREIWLFPVKRFYTTDGDVKLRPLVELASEWS